MTCANNLTFTRKQNSITRVSFPSAILDCQRARAHHRLGTHNQTQQTESSLSLSIVKCHSQEKVEAQTKWYVSRFGNCGKSSIGTAKEKLNEKTGLVFDVNKPAKYCGTWIMSYYQTQYHEVEQQTIKYKYSLVALETKNQANEKPLTQFKRTLGWGLSVCAFPHLQPTSERGNLALITSARIQQPKLKRTPENSRVSAFPYLQPHRIRGNPQR